MYYLSSFVFKNNKKRHSHDNEKTRKALVSKQKNVEKNTAAATIRVDIPRQLGVI